MEDVATRKERLKALKERKEKHEGNLQSSENAEMETDAALLPKPVFRSYQPNDENLKLSQMPKVKPINVSDIVKDEIKAAQEKNTIEEVKLVHIAPRKIDWDLKRDIAKKLEKLRRRTNRAIAEIAHEELVNGRTSIPFWNPREEPNINDDDDDD